MIFPFFINLKSYSSLHSHIHSLVEEKMVGLQADQQESHIIISLFYYVPTHNLKYTKGVCDASVSLLSYKSLTQKGIFWSLKLENPQK